jgi:GT2 family glycosyltransferase
MTQLETASHVGKALSKSTTQPFVTIVLLNWNRWRDTLACLTSLQRLSYSRFEILVVDNASDDDSIANLRAVFPQLEILVNPRNLGFSGGCNAGIRKALAKGADYVWLLNNDTVVQNDTLTRMVDAAECDEGIGAVGSVLRYMHNEQCIQAWGGGCVDPLLGIARHHTRPVPPDLLHYINGASMLIRGAALRMVGLLDDRYFLYWEDTDLSYRLRSLGWKLAVASNAAVLHKESGTVGRRSEAFHLHFNESATRFFRRFAPLPFWSILAGTLYRVLGATLHRHWRSIPAILRGTRNGLAKRR